MQAKALGAEEGLCRNVTRRREAAFRLHRRSLDARRHAEFG